MLRQVGLRSASLSSLTFFQIEDKHEIFDFWDFLAVERSVESSVRCCCHLRRLAFYREVLLDSGTFAEKRSLWENH